MTSNIEIKHTGKDIALDWDKVFDIITDVSLHGFATYLGKPPSVGTIASFLKNIRKSVKTDESPENAAFRLVLLCFAVALDELRPENVKPEQLQTARDTISGISKLTDEKTYQLEPEFFDHPVSLPLYQDAREFLIKGLGPLWAKGQDIDGKLDRAFNLSLYRILRLEKSLCDRLEPIVRGPGSEITKFENDWTAYRALLRHNFEVKPIFGQEKEHISLSDLFVTPRAFWTEHSDVEGEKTTTRHLVDLMSDMKTWSKDKEPSRCIRLIKGGPGSGKSSFAKAFCANLSQDEDARPLLVELQKLPKSGSIADRITDLFRDKEETFCESPLEKTMQDDNRPLIIVLDGLDELVMPGTKSAKNISEDVLDGVSDLLENLNNERLVRAKVVITGRDPIIDAAHSARLGRRLAQKDVLSIIGLESLVASNFDNSHKVTIKDQRELWWKNYCKATATERGLPSVFTEAALESLTTEPLLCYLVVLALSVEAKWDEKIENINIIYRKLIDNVWNRVWGESALSDGDHSDEQKAEDRRLGPVGVFKSKEDFEIILEYIAIAAWRGGESRVATLKHFENAIKNTEAEDIWVDFQKSFLSKDSEDSFSTLALTFFFKQKDLESRGFEFSHKSFGEYLAARCLFRYAVTEYGSKQKIRSTKQLSAWLSLTAHTMITSEILNFLGDEFRLCSVDILRDLRHFFHQGLEVIISEGMSVGIGDSETWRQAEIRQCNSEQSFLFTFSVISKAYLEREQKGSLVKLSGKPEENLVLIKAVDSRSTLVNGAGLVGLDLSGFVTTFQSVFDSSWLGRELNGLFVRSILAYFDLSYSNCSNRDFSQSILVGVNFFRTDLEGTYFRRSYLAQCDFSNSNISDINFSDSKVENSIFCGVKFNVARLQNTVFSFCDFSDADLSVAKNLDTCVFHECAGNDKTILPSDIPRPESWI